MDRRYGQRVIAQIDPKAVAALGPLVVPLIVAVIGLIATIVGTVASVIITQRRSDRREMVAWEREREREHEPWAREDAARTFELRRNAYMEFYEAAKAQRAEFLAVFAEVDGVEPTLQTHLAVSRAFEKVKVYGSTTVAAVADRTYEALVPWTRGALPISKSVLWL